MNDTNQKQLGKTLRAIADTLRGAMNADDHLVSLALWYAYNPAATP